MTAATPAAKAKSGLSIRRYESGDAAAIARLNARLAAGGSPHVLYEEPAHARADDALPRERLFVAADGDEIRGGAFLREISLKVGDDTITAGFVKYPVAESLVDKAFAGVPVALLVHLMRVQPNLAALGMGGHGGPFAQLLARLKWSGDIVATMIAPFSPHTVFAQLPHVQSKPKLQRVGMLARYTGAAAVGGVLLRAALRMRLNAALRSVTVQEVPSFDDRANAIWNECKSSYGALTYRDYSALKWNYSGPTEGLRKLRVIRDGHDIGWAVIQVVDLRTGTPSSQYGKLTLGILCDAFARPEHAEVVVAAATKALLNAGADLGLTNHSHPDWQRALRRFGFLRGPENFAFYRSAQLERALTSRNLSVRDVFVSRGDDGLFAR